jgi:hypothetical protein
MSKVLIRWVWIGWPVEWFEEEMMFMWPIDLDDLVVMVQITFLEGFTNYFVRFPHFFDRMDFFMLFSMINE